MRNRDSMTEEILPSENHDPTDEQLPAERQKVPLLVELLAVIALISVLVAVLLSVLTIYREKAHRATCMGNLGRIGKAVLMYTEDNDGYLPAAYGSQPMFAGPDVNPGFFSWCWLIDTYLGTGVTAVQKAGGFDVNGGTSTKGSWADSGGTLWHCPADSVGGSAMSYGVNAWVTGNTSTGEFRWNRQYVRTQDWTLSKRLVEINHPERVVFAGDSNKFWDESAQRYEQVFTDWERSVDGPLKGRSFGESVAWYRTFLTQDYTDSRGDCQSPGEWSCKGPAYRHNRTGPNTGSAMMLFCDGHVQAVPFGKLTVENIFPHLP